MCVQFLSCVHVCVEVPNPEKQQSWRRKHDSMWQGLGGDIPALWSSTHDLRGVIGSREREVIDLGHAMTRSQKLFIDVSQTATWRPWREDTIRSMVAISCYYSSQRDRTLVPQEHLQLLGWPRRITCADAVDVGSLRNLAGEAMSIPCCSAVTLALLSALPGIFENP